MKLIINGKETEIESSISLYDFLKRTVTNPSSVIVEYNFEIPEKAKWQGIILKEGDNLEIVKFIGGG